MARQLVHPALLGKMIQKVEEGEDGILYIHTKSFVLEVTTTGYDHVSHKLIPREGKPEPLTIPAKNA